MCVSPTSAPLCLCSLLHPTRHSCLLFMGTGTAGRPSRALSQWENHNIWVWCYTFTHMHARTHTHRGKNSRQTQTLPANMFPVVIFCYDTVRIQQPKRVNEAKALFITLSHRLSLRIRGVLLVVVPRPQTITAALALISAAFSLSLSLSPYVPTRLWWMAKGESFRCTSHNLLVRQSHPDSSNEKMINRARD